VPPLAQGLVSPALDGNPRHGENSAVPVERITKEQLKERMDRGEAPTILDVRLKYAYEHSTVKLPGAIRVPPYAIDSVSIPSTGDIFVYDSDPNELVGTHVAVELLKKGIKVRVLKGGVPEWMAANFPIETKEAPRSIPPEPGSLKG
jgi:rhodanese-related sulfurtransferase